MMQALGGALHGFRRNGIAAEEKSDNSAHCDVLLN